MRGLMMAFGLLVLAAALTGCAGMSGRSVGEPGGRSLELFAENLALVHEGLPADSLGILFGQARNAGEIGILYRLRLAAEDREINRYFLGWRSDPSHQTDLKDLSEIEQVKAVVDVEQGRVVRIEIRR